MLKLKQAWLWSFGLTKTFAQSVRTSRFLPKLSRHSGKKQKKGGAPLRLSPKGEREGCRIFSVLTIEEEWSPSPFGEGWGEALLMFLPDEEVISQK